LLKVNDLVEDSPGGDIFSIPGVRVECRTMNGRGDQDRQTAATGVNTDEFVRATIDRLRLKLLDLTTRNPLISFKHGSRTRRYVRAIDELPNQLFEKLADDSGMRFKSLGREPNEPEDEKTVLFRRALAAAKLEDPEYRQKLNELGNDPGEKAIERLEQELRKRLREQLGMPPRRTTAGMGPADVAHQLNLSPSFDLPIATPSEAPAARHSDSAIQTLLFEDDMQTTLARMREVVRLSIDEAGVNPLFCVFGFLEWYEDANSEIPLHAPLLLYPLSIERKLVRGQYQYIVKSSGEETQANVAIAERLKRDFGLALPPYEEEDTPESYFTKVHQVVECQRVWKVRRWITVGLFSFARIAMYHDLAPERWTSLGGLEKHEGLNRLIGGGGSGDNALFENDDEDAGNTDGELDLPLIADADSSQLAVLKDVTSGRSLVIEGPPGTGKSQTITNIIAASLAAGKTVLFLAEKMAALNVVRDRLVQAGLDDFCLELHSTKAGRKETAAALARRLNRPKQPRSNEDLQAALARLRTLREGLGRCVEALAQPAGKLGITTQELLWRCHTVRQESSNLPGEIDEIVLPGADELTEIDIGRIVGAINQFERTRLQVVKSYGSVARHPWNGVAHHDIDPIHAEDIVRRVRRLSDSACQAGQVFEKIATMTGVRLETLTNLVRVSSARLIEAPGPFARDEIVAQMAQPQLLAVLELFARQLREYSSLTSSSASAFELPEAAEEASTDDLRQIATEIGGVGFGHAKAGDVPVLREKRQQQAVAWQAVAEFMEKIANRAGWTAARTSMAERSLATGVELAALADAVILAGRVASLMSPGSVAILRGAIERAEQLKQRREALGAQFHLGAVTDSSTLRRHAIALRSAPALPFISPSWWRARKAFRGLAKEQGRVERVEMARLLDELSAYLDELNAFAADATLIACVGASFKGVDTDLANPLHVAEWAERVRADLPAGDDVNIHLRRLLFEGSADQLESLASLARDPQMAQLRGLVKLDIGQTISINAQSKAAAGIAARANQVAGAVSRLRLAPDLQLGACGELAENVTRARELRESLDSSETARTVLGALFQGHASDPEVIFACAKHVRHVDAAELPTQLRDWLLTAEATNRLASFRTVAEAANQSAIALENTLSELATKVSIDFKTWLGASSPMEVTASDLRDHTDRCAADPEGFQLLIDDARARREAAEVGMTPLLELLESHRVALEGLGYAAKRVVFQSMARDLIARTPALASFSGDRHESHRKEFRELDQKLKRLRQDAIAGALAQRHVDWGSDVGSRKQWTGLALIRNEAAKQKGHVTVRDLMHRAGTAVQQLMPCFMMSPLSVAQFLKPGSIIFDLVVMDEASQLRPEDAVGAIGRSSQIVVVGDPKQLPPTNFFREADAGDEEDDSVTDEPSILDQSLAIMRPARRLKWHYRSRHASLIAFSNKEFYDSQLVVFPSPYHDHPDFGVTYVHVADGLLRSRVNVPEAQAVAKAAMEHAIRHPDRSLGIVTLNQPQAELLSLEIDRLAIEHEEFEAWRQKRDQSLEPFFVKNLENVQGDERDTIFISTVYGPDEPGKREFAQRFGPINNQGGHRRLNVLFTRAKCQTTVFSSMDPADMRTDENSAWGVRALKGFLKFAKDGVLDVAQETGREPDSDFEVAVINTLRSAGFGVVPQVGVVGYFIDLAVRHPSRPGEFALGIECDGAMYHSSKSARDRDRLRQEVLERLKWRIYRIWSLDWYRHPNRERERLMKAVTEAVSSSA
jgi:very-short-patch-repair endonuclease